MNADQDSEKEIVRLVAKHWALSILVPSDFLSFLIRVTPRSSASNIRILKEHIP